MRSNDYYAVLGVSRQASFEDIKLAYRKKAKEQHPDGGGTSADFIRLKLAYDILSNSKSRAEYDKLAGYSDEKEEEHAQKEHEKHTPPPSPQGVPVQSQASTSTEPIPAPKRSGFYVTWQVAAVVIGLLLLTVYVTYRFTLISQPTVNEVAPTASQTQPESTLPTATPTHEPSATPEPTFVPSASTESADAVGETKPASTTKPILSSSPKPSVEKKTTITKPVVAKEKSKEPEPTKAATTNIAKTYFTLGSTKADVARVMGKAKTVIDSPIGDTWMYGFASVNFNASGIVVGWSGMDDSHAFMGSATKDATFTLHSSEQKVIAALGTPNTIIDSPIGDTWMYGFSSVGFNTSGKVVGWSSMDGKAYMGNKKSWAHAIDVGSSQQDVINYYGTPNTIIDSPIGDTWMYGYSSIEFNSKGRVTGYNGL